MYSVFGEKHIREAINNAHTSKQHLTEDVSLLLHVEKGSSLPDDCSIFDEIFEQEKPESWGWNGKRYAFRTQGMIDVVDNFNFDHYLFLDADAVIVSPEPLGIFDTLNHFDIVLVHDQVPPFGKKQTDIPDCYPEFNGGVVGFKKSTTPTLKKWLDLYLVTPHSTHPHDQGALRKVIYFSDLRVATLSPQYNCRFRGDFPNLRVFPHDHGNRTHIWHSPVAVEQVYNLSYEQYKK